MTSAVAFLKLKLWSKNNRSLLNVYKIQKDVKWRNYVEIKKSKNHCTIVCKAESKIGDD